MRKGKRITADGWLAKVRSGGMADYEGFGYPVNADGTLDEYHMLVPSVRGKDMPEGVLEVEWYAGV